MKPIQVRLTQKLREKLDKEVAKGMYPNRSEAIRDAVRKLTQRQNPEKTRKKEG